jgi:hypothetical protein
VLGSDFLGYEVSLYSVRRGRGGVLRVIFQSAEIKQGGKTMSAEHPTLQLFPLPPYTRCVRILHLTRADRGDYDSAILASDSLDRLRGFSENVERRPAACHQSADVFCSWIPLGIAVIPERREGRKQAWVPAF